MDVHLGEDQILNFIKELKYSFKESEECFTNGSCFRLFSMFQALTPSAEPYYSEMDGHWITCISNKFYDIGGKISNDYVRTQNYMLVTNETTLNSAYIPTWKGEGVPYTKYEKSF